MVRILRSDAADDLPSVTAVRDLSRAASSGLYEAEEFAPIGHGPDAPNCAPGLVLHRPTER